MKVEYRVLNSANNINQILKSTLENNKISNWMSLSSKYSEYGGFDIFNSLYYNSSASFLGPFIIAHTTVGNINWSGTACKISIKRENGTTYYFHLGVGIVVIAIIFMIGVQEFIETGKLLDFHLHIIPLICLIYMLLVELLAMSAFRMLSKKIIRLVEKEGIEVSKI